MIVAARNPPILLQMNKYEISARTHNLKRMLQETSLETNKIFSISGYRRTTLSGSRRSLTAKTHLWTSGPFGLVWLNLLSLFFDNAIAAYLTSWGAIWPRQKERIQSRVSQKDKDRDSLAGKKERWVSSARAGGHGRSLTNADTSEIGTPERSDIRIMTHFTATSEKIKRDQPELRSNKKLSKFWWVPVACIHGWVPS